ncbi:Uncharacterized protein Fot_20747 [Forsythia ovata]|uniref:Uncharacterized protein n=1 Tax=Forsythia ovata TaxID=205694 RepID=A0ABD1USV2_9LAMI
MDVLTYAKYMPISLKNHDYDLSRPNKPKLGPLRHQIATNIKQSNRRRNPPFGGRTFLNDSNHKKLPSVPLKGYEPHYCIIHGSTQQSSKSNLVIFLKELNDTKVSCLVFELEMFSQVFRFYTSQYIYAPPDNIMRKSEDSNKFHPDRRDGDMLINQDSMWA